MANVEDLGAAPPARRWRTFGALAVNLIPVIGVAFWDWNAGVLLLLYWFENVAIGVFNALRMAVIGATGGAATLLASLFLIPFFAFHYGIFCLVHGVFVWTMFGQGLAHIAALNDLPDMPRFIAAILASEPGMNAGAISIVLWQAVLFFVFIARREYRETDPMTQMFAPYSRIMILHITILAGGFVVFMLGQPWIGVVLLALLKTGFDVIGARARKKEDEERKAAWIKARDVIQMGLDSRLKLPPTPPPPG